MHPLIHSRDERRHLTSSLNRVLNHIALVEVPQRYFNESAQTSGGVGDRRGMTSGANVAAPLHGMDTRQGR